MKYAIIQLQGKQYKVHEGDELVVDRLEQSEKEKMNVTDVLLVSKDAAHTIGTPLVPKASVELEVVSHGKGDKIRVAKFRSKSRYRKAYGHRQTQTTLKVLTIKA